MQILTFHLKRNKERFLETRHPWIFSGALASDTYEAQDGDIVRVVSTANNTVICTGYYTHGSIAIRVLNWSYEEIDQKFWSMKIDKCIQTRSTLNLPNAETNCYRLCAGEGDGIPGLIIDVYQDHIVLEAHNKGIGAHLESIAQAIKENASFENSKIHLSLKYETKKNEDCIVEVKEHGHKFLCNVGSGQKTGFFLDQRDNRYLLSTLSNNKTVLNLFSYTGGFSIYASAHGAQEVTSIDISSKATQLLVQNTKLNNQSNHTILTADVMQWLKDQQQLHYDIIVLDPPAFAKSTSKKHNAVQAYKRLNQMVMSKMKYGSLLFTFSCTQVVSRDLFVHTVRAAAIESKKEIQIIKHLSQSADHAINIYHREGEYLKGMLLYVR